MMNARILSKESNEVKELLKRRIELISNDLFTKEEKTIDGVDYISLKISEGKNIKTIDVLLNNQRRVSPFTFFENNNFEILVHKEIPANNELEFVIINHNNISFPIALDGKYLLCVESNNQDKLLIYIVDETEDIRAMRDDEEFQYPRIETKIILSTKCEENMSLLSSDIILDPDTTINIFKQEIYEDVNFVANRLNKVFNYNMNEIIDIVSGKELLYYNGVDMLKIKGYDNDKNGWIQVQSISLSRDTNYNIQYEDSSSSLINLLDNTYTLIEFPDKLIYQNNIIDFINNKYYLYTKDLDKYINCFRKIEFISNLLSEVAHDEICDISILNTYKIQLEEYKNDEEIYDISENIFAMIDNINFKINDFKDDIDNLLSSINILIETNNKEI